jgi:hypothetical protein
MNPEKAIDLWKHPKKLLVKLNYRYPQLLGWMSDEQCLKFWYRYTFGKQLNLDDPKTFNEKLQWLKLHDRKPEYTAMVDKYEAKQYVAERIGEEYIIPTLGVWNSFDEIDFDGLPDQFVLKCTHDSGGLVICKDKSKLDIAKARKRINRSLKRNFYLVSREWPYKNIKPRIIAEEYMEDSSNNQLRDYKFYVFDGEVKAMLVISDRMSGNMKLDVFDADFHPLDFTRGYPHSDVPIQRPQTFHEMKQLAEKLSKGICVLRVDFYEVDGRVYFGELTFYGGSGLVKFDPESWDERFGSWLKLPKDIQT